MTIVTELTGTEIIKAIGVSNSGLKSGKLSETDAASIASLAKVTSRVTTQNSTSSSTTLTAVTGLTASLIAGEAYKIRAVIPCTSGGSGGTKIATGTSDTLTLTSSNLTAKHFTADAVAVITTTSGLNTGLGSTAANILVELEGVIVVNVAGTLTITWAQNASNATASVALVNGSLEISRIV